MLLIGIPHGALDHLVTAAVAVMEPAFGPPGVYGRRVFAFFAERKQRLAYGKATADVGRSLLGRSGAKPGTGAGEGVPVAAAVPPLYADSPIADTRFYMWYLLLNSAYTLLWWAAPQPSILLFFGLTVAHFGETDTEALNLPVPVPVPASGAEISVASEPSAMGSVAATSGGRSRGAAASHPQRLRLPQVAAAALQLAHRVAYGLCVLLALLWLDPAESVAQLRRMGGSAAPATDASGVAAAAADPVTASFSALLPLASALAPVPPAAWLVGAILLSCPRVSATAHGWPAPTPRAYARWAGFAAFLAATYAAGRLAGAGLIVPFCAYFGGWHAVQAFTHVGCLVPAELLAAQDWGAWAVRALRDALRRSSGRGAAPSLGAAPLPSAAASAASVDASGAVAPPSPVLLPLPESSSGIVRRPVAAAAVAAAAAAAAAASEAEAGVALADVTADVSAGSGGVFSLLRSAASAAAAAGKARTSTADEDDTFSGSSHAGSDGSSGGSGSANDASGAAAASSSQQPQLSLEEQQQSAIGAGALRLWLNAAPLTVGAMLMLLPLALLLPQTAYVPPADVAAVAAPVPAAGHAASAAAPSAYDDVHTPLPPVVLVLLAILTLPHAQVMHAGYGAYRAWRQGGGPTGRALPPCRTACELPQAPAPRMAGGSSSA